MSVTMSTTLLRRMCTHEYQQSPPTDVESTIAVLLRAGLTDISKDLVWSRLKVRMANERLRNVAIPLDQVLTIADVCAKMQAERAETAELAEAWKALGCSGVEESMPSEKIASFLSSFGLSGTPLVQEVKATHRGSSPVKGGRSAPLSAAASSVNLRSRGGALFPSNEGDDTFRFNDLQDLISSSTTTLVADDGSTGAEQQRGAGPAAGQQSTDDDPDYAVSMQTPQRRSSMSFGVLGRIRRYLQRFRRRRDLRLAAEARAKELAQYQSTYFPPALVLAESKRRQPQSSTKGSARMSRLPPLITNEKWDAVTTEQARAERRRIAQNRATALAQLNAKWPRADGAKDVVSAYRSRPVLSPLRKRVERQLEMGRGQAGRASPAT